MAAHSYSLRSKLSGQSPSARVTPTGSPSSRQNPRSPRKPYHSNISLQLQKVIGTTTSSPPGLACCASTNSYAYCAGAVAVLSTVQENSTTIHRYFKSKPTVAPLYSSRSHYARDSPSTTASRRRTSIFASRKVTDAENRGSSAREWLDDSNSQTWTARERIKAVACVALSDSGRWLAVGEMGYNPRVLLYSTALSAPTDTPTSIISDHAFGVRSVAFSPDSRYLATLGTLNDGFLYIWSLNSKNGTLALHSANKCTTNVSDMVWCGQYLVTVGTRHVKIWQPDQASKLRPTQRSSSTAGTEGAASPGPSTLAGRNALLGGLVDCNFTSAVATSQNTVLIGTDAGHLCALQLCDSFPGLKLLKTAEFGITSLGWQGSKQKLAVACRRGIIYEELAEIERMLDSPLIIIGDRAGSPNKRRRSSTIRQSFGLQSFTSTSASAVGCLSAHLIALDADGSLHVESTEDGVAGVSGLTFASHKDTIQGVNALPVDSDLGAFLSWSRHGDVRFWDTGGDLKQQAHIRLEQQDADGGDAQNELQVVRPVASSFVAGDRFGVLQLVRSTGWLTTWVGRAHSAEITDIAVYGETGQIATSSRDQTVQLFFMRNDSLELVQTMDDHIGAVNHVLFNSSGEKLLSCSADRTIVVRERAQRDIDGSRSVAYLSARVITLRSAPLSMVFADERGDVLLVSTMDRHIVKVEPGSGTVLESCKVTDPGNDDSVALTSIAFSSRGVHPEDNIDFLLSFSSTDKYLRIYDAQKNMLLAREAGHTEGISDFCVLEDRTLDVVKRKAVSTGLDGTIMLWDISTATPSLLTPANELSHEQLFLTADADSTPAKVSPASLPPLRKILSKLDAMEFAKHGGMKSPLSPRSLSPARLTRKKSSLALSTTISERDGESKLGQVPLVAQRTLDDIFEPERSPSPPPFAYLKSTKQRSRSEMIDPEARKDLMRRSPSPPPMPTTPRQRTMANNARLRRPPSVQTDLRAQASAPGRKHIVTQGSDCGSINMATEQACRMLRTYRKKLADSREQLNLEELEDELGMTIRVVKETKEKFSQQPSSSRRTKTKAASDNDVDELAILLERANMKETGREGRPKPPKS